MCVVQLLGWIGVGRFEISPFSLSLSRRLVGSLLALLLLLLLLVLLLQVVLVLVLLD